METKNQEKEIKNTINNEDTLRKTNNIVEKKEENQQATLQPKGEKKNTSMLRS